MEIHYLDSIFLFSSFFFFFLPIFFSNIYLNLFLCMYVCMYGCMYINLPENVGTVFDLKYHGWRYVCLIRACLKSHQQSHIKIEVIYSTAYCYSICNKRGKDCASIDGLKPHLKVHQKITVTSNTRGTNDATSAQVSVSPQ